MSVEKILREKKLELLRSFRENHNALYSLQRTALQDMLPDIKQQLNLDRNDVKSMEEYVKDTSAIFRLLKRHKFVTSFVYEALRNVLLWRMTTLKETLLRSTSSSLRILPSDVRDPYNHPILFLRLADVVSSADAMKQDVLASCEWMRYHLHSLNSVEPPPEEPILQYVIIIDLEKAPLVSMPIDLLYWFKEEVYPRFHGFFSAAFVINYSWTYSSVWNITKHILPGSAISRIKFPSEPELLRLLPSLHYCSDSDQNLFRSLYSSSSQVSRTNFGTSPSVTPVSESNDTSSTSLTIKKHRISRFSQSNPFFGYPVADMPVSQSSPELLHGRRRKRDLLRALFFLLWKRWKTGISTGFLAICVLIIYMLFLGVRRIKNRSLLKYIIRDELIRRKSVCL